MRVDGSKCYSQEKGGIYAEGYVDLNGPYPIDEDDDKYASGENAAGLAFTRIGDTVVNSSSEANNALLEYNLQNTGPQFVEVAQNDDQFTQAIMPGSIDFVNYNLSQVLEVVEQPVGTGLHIIIPQVLD